MAVVAVKAFRPASKAPEYQPGHVISQSDSSSSLLLTAWVSLGFARDNNVKGTLKQGRAPLHPLHVERGTTPVRIALTPAEEDAHVAEFLANAKVVASAAPAKPDPKAESAKK